MVQPVLLLQQKYIILINIVYNMCDVSRLNFCPYTLNFFACDVKQVAARYTFWDRYLTP